MAELDGLRGLAIIFVVLCHAFIVPADLGGVVGVTLFFVLSGYLITSLLLIERDSRGSIDLRSFYGRRALRLFPALIIYLTMLALLLAVLGIEMEIWSATWPPAFYLGNYAQILGHDVFPHRQTWSLAVEEHFYLVWPLLVVLGATRRVKPLAGAVAVLIGWRFLVGSIDLLWAYQGTDTNAFALGAGALLAVIRHQGSALRLPRVTPHIGVLLLVAATILPVDGPVDFLESSVWLAPVVTVVSLLIIWSVLDHPTPFLRNRILTWFGLISYALYLWHAPLMVLPPWSRSDSGRLVGLAIALGVAALSWHVVEGPIQRSTWRRKLVRSGLVVASNPTEVVVDLRSIEESDVPVTDPQRMNTPSLPVR